MITIDSPSFSPLELEDPEVGIRETIHFTQTSDQEAAASGVVVNLLYGIGSSDSATAAVETLGSESAVGLRLPTETSNTTNFRDAQDGAELGFGFQTIHTQPVLREFDLTASSKRSGFNLQEIHAMLHSNNTRDRNLDGTAETLDIDRDLVKRSTETVISSTHKQTTPSTSRRTSLKEVL